MSDIQRTLQAAQAALKSCQFPQSYDQWADNYNTDCCNLGYKGPVCTAEVLMKHFTLSPDQVRVLDLACGTGLVAKEVRPGFRHFVGVDASQPMLEKARLTGLYQDLHQVLLGTEPLPVNSGMEEHSSVIACVLLVLVITDNQHHQTKNMKNLFSRVGLPSAHVEMAWSIDSVHRAGCKLIPFFYYVHYVFLFTNVIIFWFFYKDTRYNKTFASTTVMPCFLVFPKRVSQVYNFYKIQQLVS
uniref:Methyltransferase domain-containing protein n=1 Tax=Neogobius melanostomus TaxID=47308 RepID=A0A8C6U7Y0_9GOBI